MKSKLVLGIAALGLSTPLLAAPGSSYIDGYYVPSASVEVENAGLLDFEEEGDGAGVKGAIELVPQVFITGEYQSNQYDDDGSDLELDTYRIGLGLGEGLGNGQGVYGRFEFINADDGGDDSEEESGVVGTIGLGAILSPQVKIYGEAGYQKFDDLDGPELLAGIALRLLPNLGVFADYRYTQLDLEDTDVEFTYDEFRVGARFYF